MLIYDSTVRGPYMDRANTYLRAGKRPEALATIAKAVALSPRDRTVLREANAIAPPPDACLLLAQLLDKNGRTAEAPPLLDQTEQLDPLHGGGPIARGDILLREGKVEDAIPAYRRAIEIDPYRVADAAQARIARAQEASR